MIDLPELCYGINPTAQGAQRLIVIKRGVSGYFPAEGYSARSEELVDLFNARMDVTPAERSAMEAGSIVGWDIAPAVQDPAMYAAHVTPRQEPGEERSVYLERVKADCLAAFEANTLDAAVSAAAKLPRSALLAAARAGRELGTCDED